MDRRALVEKIIAMEGLADEERATLLGLLRSHKKYGVVWEEKAEGIEERLRREIPVLREVADRAIVSDNPSSPDHLLIEGDNLAALVALSYTHAGKVDVIYIDPPYNTGNSDFVYNDSFVDRDDSYRHSKWLSFMSKRLRIAKHLLSDRGAIFISIDDNEHAQLKLLCDDIFGENNLVGDFVWEKTQHFGRQAKNLYSNNEYVLCYTKRAFDSQGIREMLVESVKYNLEDAPLYNASNTECVLEFPAGSVTFKFRDGEYDRTTDRKYKLLDSVRVVNGTNENAFRLKFRSRWSAATLLEEYRKGCRFLVKTRNFAVRALYQKDKSSIVSPRQIIFTNRNNPLCAWNRLGEKVGTTEEGSRLLQSIVDSREFNYPKPVSLISYLIGLMWDGNGFMKDATVLDFFAGSGTTLHAVMQLNASDGGTRRCILVTNNENGICEKVTYKRNRRAIEGYTTPRGAAVAGLKNNSLRYYRTEFVPRERTSRNMRLLVNLSTDMLCIKENLYTEQPQFGEMKTLRGIFRYFDDGNRRMVVIYREEAIGDIVEQIGRMDIDRPLKVCLFSPSEDPWEESFAGVASRVELYALPQAIYNAYRRMLPRKDDAEIIINEE